MLSLDLALDYPGFALRVAADLPATGLTAIFGRSGSGKSTLLRCIAGLEPARGHVRLNGTPWADATTCLPPHQRGIGYVFQDARLFAHLTVAGNLDYADKRARGLPGPTRDEVIAALDLAPLLTRSPAALSGGEQSRVAMGRALLTRPALMLMDEPLAALDDARKAGILPYLERLRDRIGTPILYVTHSMAEVTRLATHLCLIDAGRITHSGPLADLLADPALAPILGLREAGAVIHARLTAQDADGLSRLDTSAGPLWLPKVDAPLGTLLRIRVLAQDVILSRTRPEGLSALNILPATVTALRMGDGPGAIVQVQAGTDRLLARITRRSATALDLHPGTPVFAVLKSVATAPASIGSDG